MMLKTTVAVVVFVTLVKVQYKVNNSLMNGDTYARGKNISIVMNGDPIWAVPQRIRQMIEYNSIAIISMPFEVKPVTN